MKITLPGKDLIENRWRNQKVFREAKVKRIQYHQTSFKTNAKGTLYSQEIQEKKKDLQNQP